jgi:parallel beta-helix repeat protein
MLGRTVTMRKLLAGLLGCGLGGFTVLTGCAGQKTLPNIQALYDLSSPGSTPPSTPTPTATLTPTSTLTPTPAPTPGRVITAASCSRADVQAAVHTAVNGDTVVVPAGHCTWAQPVTIENKGITVQGSGIGVTTITDATTNDWGKAPFWVESCPDGQVLRITAFTFDGGPLSQEGAIHIDGTCKRFRIDHNRFANLFDRGITLRGLVYGVIDHNSFEAPYDDTAKGIAVSGDGDAAWQRPQALGTDQAVYIEDNLFHFAYMNDAAYDAYDGARYVFRYNTVIGTKIGHHGLDSGGLRSPHSFEVYENSFENPGEHIFTTIIVRGGSGVIFNNTISANGGSYDDFAILRNYRSDSNYSSSWGPCDGTNPIDSNTPGYEGWPCKDQIGRTTHQALSPVYGWNNSYRGSTSPLFTIRGADNSYRAITYHILENRDYYNNTVKPGYVPYPYPHPLTGATPTHTPTPTPTTTPTPIPTPTPTSANYYVNNSGSPACSNSPSSGTQTNPWCTISYAVSRITGGSNLYVKAGTYREEVYISGPAGAEAKDTLIKADSEVILYGSGVNSGRIKIANTSYITFDGFTITNYNQGLFVENSNHITVRNVTVHHVGQEGVHVHGNSSFVTIQNNTVHDTRQWQYNGEGIYIGTSSSGPLDNTNNITIRNNTIYNVNDEGIELKPGTHDCLVEGNTIYNAMRDPAYSTGAGAIEINEATISCDKCAGGRQTWGSNPNNVVRNNVVHSSKTGIRAGTGSTVFNNVVYNTPSPYYGIIVDNNASDSYTRRIYNNTVDVPSTRAIVVNGGTADVRNNIGPTSSANIATASDYYVSGAAGDYHLVAGSAPVDAGVDLSAYFNTDKDGLTRSQGSRWDIGAYEFGGGTPTSTPTPITHPPTVSEISTNPSDVDPATSGNQRYENSTVTYNAPASDPYTALH